MTRNACTDDDGGDGCDAECQSEDYRGHCSPPERPLRLHRAKKHGDGQL